MTKPTKWLCAQRRRRSAWASAQSDQSSLCAQWIAKVPSFLHVDSKDWSEWTNAQADLSLHWAHIHFVGFVMRGPGWSESSLGTQKKNMVCHKGAHFRTVGKHIETEILDLISVSKMMWFLWLASSRYFIVLVYFICTSTILCLQEFSLMSVKTDLFLVIIKIHTFRKDENETPHDKTNKMTCAHSEDSQSDQSLPCPHEETLGP